MSFSSSPARFFIAYHMPSTSTTPTPPATAHEFTPLPASNSERNPDRWMLTEFRRILKWTATVLNHYGQHKRSMMCATFAEMCSAAAAVIEGRLQV